MSCPLRSSLAIVRIKEVRIKEVNEIMNGIMNNIEQFIRFRKFQEILNLMFAKCCSPY